MKNFLTAICWIFCVAFLLVALGGVFVLIGGVVMYLTNTGTDTAFYKFFNDSPAGWGIIFGSIIAGVVGCAVMNLIMEKTGLFSLRDLMRSGGGGGYSIESSDGETSYESGSSSYSDSDSSSSSSWPYEYGTMRDPYGNEHEVTHNTIINTYTDSYGNEYKSDDGGSTFYEVDDDE